MAPGAIAGHIAAFNYHFFSGNKLSCQYHEEPVYFLNNEGKYSYDTH